MKNGGQEEEEEEEEKSVLLLMLMLAGCDECKFEEERHTSCPTRPVLDPLSAHGVARRRAQLGGGGGGVGVGACSWVGVGVVACPVGRVRATDCWPSGMMRVAVAVVELWPC